jgi:tRNA threonylcarbamoyladenosine modification (KEOPS) complex Cgi121 subunit
MVAFLAESGLDLGELKDRAARLDALVLDPNAARSQEALRLALHLAESASAEKKAISRKPKYEFLLWLTGKTDIRSALEISSPKDAKDLLIISFGEKKSSLLKTLEARERKKALKIEGDALELEGISLSRIRN